MYEFQYQRPDSIAGARTILEQDEEASLLAGGMTLLPAMKLRLAGPSQLVDLSAVDALKGIESTQTGLRIGAMSCHADVAASATVCETIPALAELAGGIGDAQVRNRGTIGGSIANNDPAADYPAAVLALDATVKTDRREIRADDFFLGLFETALEVGEIIESVSFPRPQRAAYLKFPNPASRYAIVGVFVAVGDSGVRVAVTGAGACVYRATDIEAALTTQFDPVALDGIAVDSAELNSDLHASADYRAYLVGLMARRAVVAASG